MGSYPLQEGVCDESAGDESISSDQDSTGLVENGCPQGDLAGPERCLSHALCTKNG